MRNRVNARYAGSALLPARERKICYVRSPISTTGERGSGRWVDFTIWRLRPGLFRAAHDCHRLNEEPLGPRPVSRPPAQEVAEDQVNAARRSSRRPATPVFFSEHTNSFVICVSVLCIPFTVTVDLRVRIAPWPDVSRTADRRLGRMGST